MREENDGVWFHGWDRRGSFFDHIDDLIDFPADNGCGLGSGGCADFPSIWAKPPAALPGSDPILSNNYSASDLSAELSIPVSIHVIEMFEILGTSSDIHC